MIIAVAERLVNPMLLATDVAAWRAFWGFNPLAAVLGTPALPEGPSRTRLQKLFGFSYRKPAKIVNLLPPDSVPGAWDPELAETVAYRLLTYALIHGHKLVLLGRRVADAFQAAADLQEPLELTGGFYELGYVQVLCLPHPSGRSRVLNDPANQEVCRKALEIFAAESYKRDAV